MPVATIQTLILEAKQESKAFFGRGILEVGAAAGSIGSLGAVVGFIAALLVEALGSAEDVSYGEWIAYSGALAGLLAVIVELSHRAS